MRTFFKVALFLCIVVYGTIAQSQTKSDPLLDTIIGQFERRDLQCRPALMAFEAYFLVHPTNALAALYIGRAYGEFSGFYGCTEWNPKKSLQFIDSEFRYYELARQLKPTIRTRGDGFTIDQAMGHTYGAKAMLDLCLLDTQAVISDLKAGFEQGGFSIPLVRFSQLLLNFLPQDAIYISSGDDDTFPLWYLQWVLGIRRDVSIININLLAMPWYEHVVSEGVSPGLTSTPFAQVLGASDTMMDFPDDVYRELEMAGTSSSPVPFPIDSSVYDDIARNLGYDPPRTPMIAAFHCSPDNRSQSISSDMVQRILFANKWRRPVYVAMGTYNTFNGVEPYVRQEGFAGRLFPDTGKQYVPELRCWTDTARFSLALNEALRYAPYADSLCEMYLFSDFLYNPLSAYLSQYDTTKYDEVLSRFQTLAHLNPQSAYTNYGYDILAIYGIGHSGLRDEVEWLKSAYENLLWSPALKYDMNVRELYATTLSVLHQCEELRTFYTNIFPPSEDHDQEVFRRIEILTRNCH